MKSIVLKSGRVIDPGTAFDQVADLRIEAGHVAAIGHELHADTEIDATGLIVGPGFIDLHSHVHSIAGHRLQALDGVTTALDLEAGLMPVADGYQRAANEGRPLNYGFSASWAAARGQVLVGVQADARIATVLSLLSSEPWQRPSSAEELHAWLELLRADLEAGALGIGVMVGYAPESAPAEFLAVARLAAAAGVATYTHVRELIEADPHVLTDGPSELVRAAAETGARMHHCHVNSTSRRHVDRVLADLAAAQAAGSKISVEAYPYGAASTSIGAHHLAPDLLATHDLKPSSLVLLHSGERVADAARLRQLRATEPESACIVEQLDESNPTDMALLRRSLAYPDAVVASDAIPVQLPGGATDTRAWPLPAGSLTHPRTAGTYAKTLRLMVRETGSYSWPEAFRRCSYLPARVLDFAPAAHAKGHLGVGADADIIVLDPQAVTDTATYTSPVSLSVGVRHLLVGGNRVVRDGQIVADALPGRPLRASPR